MEEDTAYTEADAMLEKLAFGWCNAIRLVDLEMRIKRYQERHNHPTLDPKGASDTSDLWYWEKDYELYKHLTTTH